MSMNKFMHPRNPYKVPPNFKELAIKYPEFRKFAKTELSGKVVIDFKDQASIRALTCTLLEKDFGLLVEIPLDRLIPTLPLRLNYLLWIEDLLHIFSCDNPISGVDIGTGASCIYPLLAAKWKGWSMLATEVDLESADCAARNVKQNNLDTQISVRKAEVTQLLLGMIDEEKDYHFTMCNPPFFCSEDELDSMGKARSPSRTPPSNAPSGSLGEVVVHGGEVAFVRRIIEESKQIGQRIMLYTSMLGHKRNVSVLMEALTAAGVTSKSRTEFCQGNTTRWGIAWTFCPQVQLPSPSQQLVPNKKLQQPMSFTVPQNTPGVEYTLKGMTERVKQILTQLQMTVKQLKQSKFFIAMQATAYTNTWSNQRRKRRESKLKATVNGSENGSDAKRAKLDLDSTTFTSPEKLTPSSSDALENSLIVPQSTTSVSTEKQSSSSPGVCVNPTVVPQSPTITSAEKPPTSSTDTTVVTLGPYLLQTQVLVRSVADELMVELTWTGGTCGRDTVHQVLQFIKNHIKP